MTKPHRLTKTIFVFSVFLAAMAQTANLQAWTEHTLITYPVAASMPQIKGAASVKVESLESFLVKQGDKLEAFLREQEEWSRKHLEYYAPLPDDLFFKSSTNGAEARKRFIKAVRISPNSLIPLYLQLMPGQDAMNRPRLAFNDVTYVQDKSDIRDSQFVSLKEGETVSALDVITTASNEPDLGLDIGLFADNKTESGSIYGFGIQPFGNPNLEFGSQAPFHMGFYHESPIIFRFAGFLKKTYPEYRIHLYKKLAQFAFSSGHDYWGWRFAGWGLHYLADLAQPYHATVLPGVSTAKALWINTIDMLGFHQAKENAVQLVSNRHLAFEKVGQIALRNAYLNTRQDHPVIKTLQSAPDYIPPYNDWLARDVIAKKAYDKAAETDRIIVDCIPARFVSDPKFEFGTSEDQFRIVEIIQADKGRTAVDTLLSLTADLLSPYAIYGRSYIDAVRPQN